MGTHAYTSPDTSFFKCLVLSDFIKNKQLRRYTITQRTIRGIIRSTSDHAETKFWVWTMALRGSLHVAGGSF